MPLCRQWVTLSPPFFASNCCPSLPSPPSPSNKQLASLPLPPSASQQATNIPYFPPIHCEQLLPLKLTPPPPPPQSPLTSPSPPFLPKHASPSPTPPPLLPKAPSQRRQRRAPQAMLCRLQVSISRNISATQSEVCLRHPRDAAPPRRHPQSSKDRSRKGMTAMEE